MSQPTVGLAIIARDEAKRLPGLLDSIVGAFDQIVLVDTGSKDRTVQKFMTWCRKHDQAYVVEHFKWVKDFSAAREYADSFLTTDWKVWADCDDVIKGAQNIRGIVAQAQENIVGFIAGYNYAQHPQNGEPVCYLRRERIVRTGGSHWVNRVHEAQLVKGPVVQLSSDLIEWVHQKQAYGLEEATAKEAGRNLEILDQWNKDEPGNSRVLAYLGTENAAKGEINLGIQYFNEYLALDPEWDEERAQVHRKLATCHLINGDFDAAIECAFAAMRVLPSWPDSYITLAEAHHAKGEHPKAVEWAQEALRRGAPDTMLIVNPLDYTYQPRKILAGSLASMQKMDEAIQIGTEAWQINPMDEELGHAIAQWRAHAKREHTANSVAMLAQTLMAHDEQLKALDLLENCVPHFAADHQGVVQLRSLLRERLAWIRTPETLEEHYATGGSKPEDFLPEDKLDEVPASLPRVHFLIEGIYDQMMEAHIERQIKGALDDQLPAMIEAMASDPS